MEFAAGLGNLKHALKSLRTAGADQFEICRREGASKLQLQVLSFSRAWRAYRNERLRVRIKQFCAVRQLRTVQSYLFRQKTGQRTALAWKGWKGNRCNRLVVFIGAMELRQLSLKMQRPKQIGFRA